MELRHEVINDIVDNINHSSIVIIHSFYKEEEQKLYRLQII